MLPLPDEMPKWYTVEPEQERGWTPKTEDIIEVFGLPEVIKAWENNLNLQNSKQFTIKLDRLQIISPIQVGAGSVFEGGILPAQIGGLPCIPASSIRGALLKWIKDKWEDIPINEREFWQNLILDKFCGWKPKRIRFESIYLKNLLKAFPLHSQQKWQIFNKKSKQLSVQWQVQPKEPPGISSNKLCVQILLRTNSIDVTNEQKKWLETRLTEMLQCQGIGRGTSSGFGRLAASIPSGNWQIKLTGMKPCVQQLDRKKQQWGKYRWSPQVLRANLRGYFTRLALPLLSEENALKLTDKIFGSLNSPAQLVLTSYLFHIKKASIGQALHKKYANIESKDAHSNWLINVNCNSEFQELVGALLNLASYLGGLGPGWRRPPHELKSFSGYRGSEFTLTLTEFTLTSANLEESIEELIKRLQKIILNLAHVHGLPALLNPVKILGSVISIWQGETKLWEKIVHDICRSDKSKNPNPNRPSWCGTTECPSKYTVRQHENFCLVTVFDPDVEGTLKSMGFKQVWC